MTWIAPCYGCRKYLYWYDQPFLRHDGLTFCSLECIEDWKTR